MPAGMFLKSTPDASSISAPVAGFTLEKLGFLGPDLRASIRTPDGSPASGTDGEADARAYLSYSPR
jgi:hypothetical protein